MTIAVDQYTTKPWSLEEDFRNYARAGVEAIEFCEEKLPLDPEQAAVELERLNTHPARVVSVQARVHSIFPDRMSPGPSDPDERAALFRKSIRRFAEVFPAEPLSFILISGVPPGGNIREGWDVVNRICPELAAFAADHDIRIAFEPLGPECMWHDTFIHGLDQGLRVIDRVNRENFGLVVDTWHVWQEHRLLERLESCAERVQLVHACDWPKESPRCQDDRLLPGDGVIDLRAIFGALKAGGFRGPWVLEVLSDRSLPDSLWNMDPELLLRRGIDSLRRIVESA